MACSGMAGVDWTGKASQCKARSGLGRQGKAWPGGRGPVWQGMAGESSLGTDCQGVPGMAGRVEAWRGADGLGRLGGASQGTVRREGHRFVPPFYGGIRR